MQASKSHDHITKASSSDKGQNVLARTEQEEKLEVERRKAIITEQKMKAKAEKAMEKLDMKQSHQHYGNRKVCDRYHGHQAMGANARNLS